MKMLLSQTWVGLCKMTVPFNGRDGGWITHMMSQRRKGWTFCGVDRKGRGLVTIFQLFLTNKDLSEEARLVGRGVDGTGKGLITISVTVSEPRSV